ncbi:MAG: LamG domain-containing protein [Sedimentisphaerales bacterium]|nr:LamG domain-containing protein [Sedimentisphaerales bacterium]
MHATTICRALLLAIILAVPVSAELIGYWKLNEGSEAKFLDETDYWHDGTISPWDPATVRWTSEGYDSNALEFLSATTLTTIAEAPLSPGALDISEATCSFWMNMPTAYQAWGVMFDLLGTTADHSIEPDGTAGLGIGNAGGNGPWYWYLTKNVALNDNQWHHVVVTYSKTANQCVAYIDGKENNSAAFSLSEPITKVRIGGPRYYSNVWRRYLGRLDEVAVYNHALNAADVQTLAWYGPGWAHFAGGAEPANGAILGSVDVTLRWTPGDTAAQHHLYIGQNADDVQSGAAATDQGITTETSFSGYPYELGETYYWRVDEIEADGVTVHPGKVWSFTISAKFASSPSPADGAVLVDPNAVLSWTAGSGALYHTVFLGLDPVKLVRVVQAQTKTTYDPAPFAYDRTYYWRIDEFDGKAVQTGQVWSFKTTPNIRITDPNLVGFWNFDQDEKGICIDWSGRGRHGEILGEPNSIVGYNLAAWAFDGVDDCIRVPQVVGADLTLMAWVKADVPGPAGTTARAGSGLLWSDAAGGGDHFTVAVLGKKLAFETGPGGNPNTISIADVVTGEWTHAAVTRAESTKGVQIFINGALDATGTHTDDRNVGSCAQIVIGANALDSRYFKGAIDEVRAYDRVLSQLEIASLMRGDLSLAWNPKPAMGEIVDITYDKPLSWSAGDAAAEHDVYLGMDRAAVEAATPQTAGIYEGRQADATYSLAEPLQWKQTYYWRIDEVGADATVARGRVWSFVVADYLLVDTFESYTNDSPNRVFQTWIDGIGFSADEFFLDGNPGNGTGAAVGHDIWGEGTTHTTIMETSIVHGGRQSMPLYYDNSDVSTGYKSEAERTWPAARDWTVGNIDTLQLYFRGNPVDFLESASGSITLSGAGADIWGLADEFRFAFKTLTGNGSIVAKVDRLVDRDPWTKAGVMIRQSLDVDSAFAAVYVSGDSGIHYQARLRAMVEAVSDTDVSTAEQNALREPAWIKIERAGDQFNGYYSLDGAQWTAMSWNPQTLYMTGPVYIGLAVTSHVVGNPAVAEFSGVKTTGNVSGAWNVEEVGGVHPANSRADLYVALQDSRNRTAVVKYADGAIATDWTQWDVPLNSFTGVDMSTVEKMVIGVGDRGNPQADGTGVVYVDDIRVIKAVDQ